MTCFFCLLVTFPDQATAEDLWYTIQAGSYLTQKDAEAFTTVLSDKLNEQDLPDLRVEYISSYYTVRAGKFKTSMESLPLLKKIQAVVAQPLIIFAYVRPARITWPPQDFIPMKNADQPPSTEHSKQQKPSSIAPQTDTTTNKKIATTQESLFYTIQVGSYIKRSDATRLYDNLAKQLPSEMRLFLRIEKISSFFAVRFGKKSTRMEISPLLDEAKKVVSDPTIIHAYILDNRTVTRFSPILKTNIEPIPPRIIQANNIQPEVQANYKTPLTKPTEPQKRQPKEAIPEDFLPRAKNSEQEETQPVKAKKKAKPAMTHQEYEKILKEKYLDTSHQTKDRIEAKKRAASFTTSTDCTTASCHTTLQTESSGHYPVTQAKCLSCHKQSNEQHPSPGKQDFELAAQGTALCQQCHLSIIQGDIIHSPAGEGECLKCHNPHGSGNPFLLPVTKDKEQELCMKCHDRKLTDHRYQHGPVGLGKCTFCHNPHASQFKNLLRDEPTELCINCHDEFKRGMDTSPFIHKPVIEQECQTCHSVHGSEFPSLLAKDPHTFCFSCHPDVEDKFNKARTKHAGIYLEKQCGTCHTSHYSPNKYLLVKEEKELCFTCHGNNSALTSYSPKNIEKEISNKEYIHAPLVQGSCTGCHDPHGSQFDSLLLDRYQSTFYAPYDPERYALCFNCHDQELLTSIETEDATNFRNGSHNLHFVHVGFKRKGRTCNACHNSHASDGPKLINRAGAKFGEWIMSIDFNLSENGGSCMPGCHRKMTYDRKTQANNVSENATLGEYFIDYKSSAPGEKTRAF